MFLVLETLEKIISLVDNHSRCMGNEHSNADYPGTRDWGSWSSLEAAGIIYDRESSEERPNLKMANILLLYFINTLLKYYNSFNLVCI